jgi:HPt (histidine-containing phosphotransfer) domain-containing protein
MPSWAVLCVSLALGRVREVQMDEHNNSGAVSTGVLPSLEWDIPELLERLDGDEEFLRELLVIFQQDAPKNLEASRQALAARNCADLTRAAHTLKGMLKNLAMKAAAQTAAALEDAARKDRVAESGEHFLVLERELEVLRHLVEARLAEARS